MNQLKYGRDADQDLSHGESSVAVVVVTFHGGVLQKALLEEVFQKVLRSNRLCCITLIQLYLCSSLLSSAKSREGSHSVRELLWLPFMIACILWALLD